MDLSIVIVSWNVEKLLAACLTSILNHRLQGSFEIWVVDNASTDETPSLVRNHFPQVKLIENKTNIGFAAANNQAMRRCTGEFILLLNPDTEIQSGALDTLVSFLKSHSNAGAAGPRILNPDGSLQPSCSPAPGLWSEARRLLHLPGSRPDGTYDMAAWDPVQPREVDVLLGACLLLRRSALDEVGYLDEDYFVYSEEVDLCRRLQVSGWHLYWVPPAQVIHYGGQSTRQVAAEMFFQLYRGKTLYFRKHHGRAAALLYKGILLVASLARLAVSSLPLRRGDPQWEQGQVMARNYRRLLLSLPRL